MAKDIIVNNLLCFIYSASNDFTVDTLNAVIYSFYSLESIKSAKEVVVSILDKNSVERRDPHKKKKEVEDLIELFNELDFSKNKITFVCDSYKEMPPVGMQFISPMLINIYEELNKMNEILPKIMDIKKEVINTADTLRNMRIDVSDLQRRFSCAIVGMEKASEHAAVEKKYSLDGSQTFKQQSMPDVHYDINIEDSIQILNNIFNKETEETELNNFDVNKFKIDIDRPNYNNEINKNHTSGNKRMTLPTGSKLLNKPPGSKSTISDKDRNNTDIVVQSDKNLNVSNLHDNASNETSRTHCHSMESNKDVTAALSQYSTGDVNKDNNEGWTLVSNRNRRKSSYKNNQSRTITGSKKVFTGKLKAARRIADIFIGRVEKSVTIDDVKSYIKENISIDILDIEKLVIKTDQYNAFKVKIYLDERDKAINAENWPENIMVGKFYSRN